MDEKVNQGLSYLYEGYKLLSENYDLSTIQKMLLYFDRGISKSSTPIFTAAQMQIINHGFYKGLTEEQVNLFADPIYNHKQMEQIEIALLNGYNKEKLKMLTNPIFNAEQMEQIRLGLSKYPKEYIQLYALPEYSAEQMFMIRESYARRVTPNQLRPYLSPDFSEDQIKKLALSFEFGLTEKQVQIVAQTRPVENELNQLINEFLKNKSVHASIDNTIQHASKTKETLNQDKTNKKNKHIERND